MYTSLVPRSAATGGAAAAEFLDAHGGGCGTAAACDMPRKGMTLWQRRCSRQPSFRRQRQGAMVAHSLKASPATGVSWCVESGLFAARPAMQTKLFYVEQSYERFLPGMQL